MTFQPGKSGNPGGRPKGSAEVRDLAQRLTARSFEELERMAFTSDDDRVRLDAIRIILDRGYGRPAQAITGGEDDDGGPRHLVITWAGEGAE